jgi:hypothetical protein
LSRKRIFALFTTLVALVALTALLSACGGGSSEDSPEKVIEQATFEGVESGEIDVALNVKSEGKEGGEMKVSLSGPFQSTGMKSLPELAMTTTANGEANGEKIDFEGGLTVLSDRAYIGYDGNQYEVDPTTFGFVKSGFEKNEQEGAGESKGAEATACQKAATSLDLSEFVDNLENEGGEEVDGVKTTKLSGDLNPQKAVAAAIKLAETPACSSELQAAGPLPLSQLKSQEGELTGAIKKAHAEIYVGEDDHIVRKVVADFTVEPKGSGEKTETSLEVTLSKVNEKVAIKAPTGAKPLTDLFGELGISLNEISGLFEGGGTEDLGSLIEGIVGGSRLGGGSSSGGGESSSGGSGEEAELPLSPEFTECLKKATGAADVQKCASLME